MNSKSETMHLAPYIINHKPQTIHRQL